MQLRPKYEMQKKKQKRQTRETEEQLRQLGEQKTHEKLELEIDIDVEHELRSENSEKSFVPHIGDFLRKISCSDQEDCLGENQKITQGGNQQKAKDVEAASQRKYSNS